MVLFLYLNGKKHVLTLGPSRIYIKIINDDIRKIVIITFIVIRIIKKRFQYFKDDLSNINKNNIKIIQIVL